MKTILATAAALGLSLSAAAACPYSKNTTASVDKDLTVASIDSGQMSRPAPTSTPAEKAE